jgi:hypothetical protein
VQVRAEHVLHRDGYWINRSRWLRISRRFLGAFVR